MKAALFRSAAGRLQIESLPDPVPGPGEVLLEVRRVGICGSELHAASFHAPERLEGALMGHEICGRVVALGEGVSDFALGDRVVPLPFIGCGHCAMCLADLSRHCPQVDYQTVRGYCQYTRAAARGCVQVPDSISDEAATLVEPLAVGLRGVRRAALQAGERVLVTGAGPIGLAAAFWAQALGAANVAVLARSDRRRRIAEQMGLPLFVAGNDVDDEIEAVQSLLGGAPDIVLEAVGLPGALEQAVNHVRPLGRIVSLGFGNQVDALRPDLATWKDVSLAFSLCYGLRDFEHTVRVLASGETRPLAMITSRIGLDQLPETFASLQAGGEDCKVIVSPWG